MERGGAAANRLMLAGQIGAMQALRYTPAGAAVLELRIVHRSRQTEAGIERTVECEMPALAIGETAKRLSRQPLGSALTCSGFVAARRQGSDRIEFHGTDFELFRGNDHAPTDG